MTPPDEAGPDQEARAAYSRRQTTDDYHRSPESDAVQPDGFLSEEHAAMLAGSGITREHAELRGYQTVTICERDRLRFLGFSARVTKRVPGLLIPLLGADGAVWGHQLRPDSPYRPDNGEIVKYETPHDQRNGLDIPPGVGDLLGDPRKPLWITEGSKKADCAAAQGLCCISVSGVWN